MIELKELLRILVERRWTIVGVFSGALAASLLLLVSATPVYRASIQLLAPDGPDAVVRDLSGIALADVRLEHRLIANRADPGSSSEAAAPPDYVYPFQDVAPTVVYHQFLENLRSLRLRREFFELARLSDVYARQGYLPDSGWSPDRIFEERFNSKLLVYWGGEAFEEKFVRVSFDFEDPQAAADTLNGFVAMVERRTAEQIVDAAALDLAGEISLIEAQIAAAADGASALGDRLRLLSGIRLSSASFTAARIDQPALLPRKPVFPRPATTLALGSLVGLILGFAAAFALSSKGQAAGTVPVY